MPDNPMTVAGWIAFFRLIISAVNSGKIDSREVEGLSDDGVEVLITQLQQSDAAEIERGDELDPAA